MRIRPLLVLVAIGAVVIAAAVLAVPQLRTALRIAPGTDAAPHADHSPSTVRPGSPGTPGDDVPARGEVTIDPRRQQLIGVRIAPVRKTTISHEVRAPGVVRFDETRQSEITTKVDGWIRDLRADYTGRTVTRGEPLFMLYSPALLAAQNEYLLAVRGHAQASSAELPSVRDYAERLHQAARERLLRWDLSEDDIREIEQRGKATDTLTFRSPVTGTIVEKIAVEGMRVMAGQTLFRVADLSVV
jgi:hypothetical protein